MDKKRCREDFDESPEIKRLRANLLDILEDDVVDTLNAGEFDPNSSPESKVVDLVTVMKSFEEEIGLPLSTSALVSDSAESLPDLGFLLEASDDELGLPPSFSGPGQIDNYLSSEYCDELLLVEPEENPNPNLDGSVAGELGQIWGFGDEISSFGLYGASDEIGRKETEESVVFDGLFDYSNDVVGDQSVFSWRQTETLPAVQ